MSGYILLIIAFIFVLIIACRCTRTKTENQLRTKYFVDLSRLTDNSEEREKLRIEREKLDIEKNDYFNKLRKEVVRAVNSSVNSSSFRRSPIYSEFQEINIPENKRLMKALKENMSIISIPSVSAEVQGESRIVYDTTLTSCTCEDYLYSHKPCKHMYRLAIEIGFLRFADNSRILSNIDELSQENNLLFQQKKDLEKEKNDLKNLTKKEEKARKEFFSQLEKSDYDTEWLSLLFADYELANDGLLSMRLRLKSPPAKRAAEEVDQIRHEKREWVQRAKHAEYELALMRAMYPEYDDTEVLPVEDIPAGESGEVISDPALKWLSKEEYASLPRIEKYQLALDRYKSRNKSKWEIGIDFEYFIGYRYYLQGYHVEQSGASQGVNDLGRDLLAKKGNEVLIIQCKRWGRDKTIRENAVCQLHGTVSVYQSEHPKQNVLGVLICTRPLSDTAKRFADVLDIQYQENVEPGDYPLIKCNINSTTKERIYHLPFDQQYNRVVISPNSDECFAWTVQEAEEKGFRRAFRWRSKEAQ